MSVHALRTGRLRVLAAVPLALTTAALSVAIGAAPAAAFTGDHPVPPKDGPGDSRPGETDPGGPKHPEAPETGTMRGRVWIDVDKDGIQDADERKGVEGAKVTVKVLDPKNPAQLEVLTDKQGKYTVPNIPAGDVKVTVLPPVAADGGQWRFSPVSKGDDRAKDNDYAEVKSGSAGQLYTGVIEKLKIRANQEPPPNRDAGVYLEPKTAPEPEPEDEGVISGRVWNDVDKDGIQDKGEAGVADLPVAVVVHKLCAVLGSDGKVRDLKKLARPGTRTSREVRVSATDAEGNYAFADLPAGKYCVVVAAGPIKDDKPVKVWTFSPKDVGDDDSVDSDVKAVTTSGIDGEHAISSVVKLVKCKGGDKKTVDAGVYKKASEEPVPTPSATPSPTAPPVPSEGGGSLPVTGAAVGAFLAAGALLVGGGVLLTVLGRRRRTAA